MESKAFHICPFCHAPSHVSESRCKACGRSLVGLPLAVYGSELDAAMAPLSTEPLVDLPLRERELAGEDVRPAPARPVSARPRGSRRAGRAAMRRLPREPRPAAIVGMAASLAAAIALGAILVRPRRPAPAAPPPATMAREAGPRASAALETPAPVTVRPKTPSPVPVAALPVRPRPEIYTLHPDVRPDRGDVQADPADVRRARQPVASDTQSQDDEASAPDGDALVLRAQLRRAEEDRDRLADRVDRLRARLNEPVVTDVGRYQRLQGELETAREDLDRAQAEVARWRRALRRVG